jgi:hypothetical protein
MTSTSTNSTAKAFSKVTKLLSMRKSDDSTPPVVHEDIKALRTILTMLSLLHRANHPKDLNPLAGKSPPVPTNEQTKELRVLSALATILVTEHEKVAVVAKNGNGRNVEVFTFTDSIAADKSTTKSLSANIIEYLRSFIVTINPRDKANETYPTIYNPKDGLSITSGATLDDLKTNVKNHWSNSE